MSAYIFMSEYIFMHVGGPQVIIGNYNYKFNGQQCEGE